MTKNFDAVIVGAGIVGAACAAALARESLSVLVVDAGDIAGGATATGMGHIVAMDDSEPQFTLSNYSRQLWKDLAKELPPECEYDHCGTIWVASDEVEMNEVRRKQEYYAERRIAAEVLDQRSLLEAEPNLSRNLGGGLLVGGDSVVYQPAATRYLVDKVVLNGGAVRNGSAVSKISDDGVELADGERFTAGAIVNAAGNAAPALSRQLRIAKRKGHLVITDRYHGFVRHQLIELGYLRSAHGRDSDSVAFNVQPRKTGQILLGSSRQFGVESANVDPAIVRRMTERAFRFMPGLRDLNAIRVWPGFRPATPDNLPYIGRIPGFDRVYAAAGHEGLGITTSLGTAELIAAEIIGRKPAIPPEPYSPARNVLEH